jgi:hypothetical protein
VNFSDPCKTATLLTPTVAAITVTDGAEQTGTFTDVGDSLLATYGALGKCGARTFEIYDDAGTTLISWASVALTSGASYTITVSPSSPTGTELQAAHALKLKVSNGAYATQTPVFVDFTVTVTAAVCDCADQPWTSDSVQDTATAPVGSTTTHLLPLPVVDTVSMTTPQLRQCLADASCASTGTFAAASGSPLEDWMAFDADGTSLELTPTSGGQNGSFTVQVTFTPDDGSAITYAATIVTVTCTVVSISSPAAPTTGLSYSIFDPSLTIPIPGDFVQTPACGYTGTESYVYTIPVGNCASAISEGTVAPPSFVVHSVVGAHAEAACTVAVATTITYSAG